MLVESRISNNPLKQEKNLLTEKYFNTILEQEEQKRLAEQQKIRRALYLLKRGQWSPYWDSV